jgi:hypothetical protein
VPTLRVAAAQPAPRETTQAELQTAHHRFDFLATLAHVCPTSTQRDVIGHALSEFRFAGQLPGAPPREELVARRDSLQGRLRQELPHVRVRRDSGGWSHSSPAEPLTVADGMSRWIVVELENGSDLVIDAAIRCGDTASPQPGPIVVHPGVSQPFLVAIEAAQVEAASFENDRSGVSLAIRCGDDEHRLSLDVQTVQPAKIIGRLIDQDSDSPTAGRVWVKGGDRQYRRAGPLADSRSFAEKPLLEFPVPRFYAVPFFYADGSFEIEVPPGPATVTLERGFEHRLVTEPIELSPGEVREVTLRSGRFLDARSDGWVSGDTHIHWVTNAWNVDLPVADLSMVQRAEDLRVANNLTLLHRTSVDAFIKPSQAPVGPIAAFSDGDYHIEMAEEYRNQNLYGHLCFLNLQWLVLPIGTGPDIAGDDSLDYPINKTAILEARRQGAISIEAHGVGANHELPLNAVHGLADSIDQIDPDDYYRLLDCGFQLPLTNGSDHPARIAGCARAYVKIDGDFDYEKWVDGIRRGQTFTTSGPLLFLTASDSAKTHHPGAVITPAANETISIVVDAHSRFPLGKVQIISNGQVIKELETDALQARLECDLPSDDSRWVVARCSRDDHWNPLWHPDIAHTSAVYVHRDSPVFRVDAARWWIDRMRLHRRDILIKGRFATEVQRQEATDYVDEAIRRYEWLVTKSLSEKGSDPLRRGWQTDGIDSPPKGQTPFRIGSKQDADESASVDADEGAAAQSVMDDQRNQLLMLAGFVSPRGHESELVRQVKDAGYLAKLKAAAEPLTLLRVTINPESRVKLALMTPPETLVQHRTHRFLVEIHNQAGIRAPLNLSVWDQSVRPAELAPWCDIRFVENLISSATLSGEETEWKIVELRCDEVGRREVRIEADAGQGTQDLGFRATADLLLKCVPREAFRAKLEPTIP